ncbi:MAG: CRTAC1 family protein [Lentisphaeria bacterium]
MNTSRKILCATLFIAGAVAAGPVVWDGSGSPASAGFATGGNQEATVFKYGTPEPGLTKQFSKGDPSCHFSYASEQQFQRAAGWHVEWRVDVKSASGSDGFGVSVVAQDEVGGVGILHTASAIHIYPADFNNHTHGPGGEIAKVPIAAGFHRYEATVAPGSDFVSVLVDGTPVAHIEADRRDGQPRLTFGDGGRSGSDAIWDYVYINKSAPPEKSLRPADPVKRFVNVTQELGLEGIGDANGAWIDYNADGWVDVQTNTGLWRNEEGKRFVMVGPASGQGGVGDFNNDGYPGFFNALNGIVEFGTAKGLVTVTELRQRPHGVSDAGALLDFDGDGLLDIYWAGYEDWGNVAGYPDGLYHNVDGNSFKLNWATEGFPYASHAVTVCDFDQDGDTDIYVTNYRLQPNLLWINQNGDGFVESAGEYGVIADSGHGIGSAWGDIDNDGDFDLFAGNFAHAGQPQSVFLRNKGEAGDFHFESLGSCGVHYQESYGSPALGDYDNDGDLDLFFTTVYSGDSPVLFRNDTTPGRRFRFNDVTKEEGLARLGPTKQAAWGDFDNDGDLDLLTCGMLLRNSTLSPADPEHFEGKRSGSQSATNWLKVRLEGARSQTGQSVNRSAIGAQVRLRPAAFVPNPGILSRQVESTTGRGNTNDLTLHFGLGDLTGDVQLEITWPFTDDKQIVTTPVNRLVVYRLTPVRTNPADAP